MAGDKNVPLSQRYEAHGRTFDRLTFREPKMADYEAIGEVAEYQPAPGGGMMIINHDDRVWQYRDRLLKRGEDLPDAGDIGQLTLADSIAVKEAITDFFTQARVKPSAGPQTS